MGPGGRQAVGGEVGGRCLFSFNVGPQLLLPPRPHVLSFGSVCKVRTQDPENLDEEVKSLVTAWRGLLEKPMKPPAVQRLGNRPLHLQVLAMGRIRIRIRVDVEKGRPGTRN